jgi:hypothetical protein
VLFAGSMLGLVLADNLLALFLFWELTSVTSYLLIGFDDTKAQARAAALQAILITGAGGLAMLGGFVILGQEADTYSLSDLLAAPPSGTRSTSPSCWCWSGVFTKSAQVPVPLLAAGRHGRPHPGQRLPALRHHGEGRCLPGRPLRPGLRHRPPWRPSCSPSAWPPCSSAACAPCASTT